MNPVIFFLLLAIVAKILGWQVSWGEAIYFALLSSLFYGICALLDEFGRAVHKHWVADKKIGG